jgi:hypothetical protein
VLPEKRRMRKNAYDILIATGDFINGRTGIKKYIGIFRLTPGFILRISIFIL